MFARVKVGDVDKIDVYIDDVAISCVAGDTVAAVMMLEAGKPYRRTLISGSARAPLCMMGICFDCLVEIDGVANQQGCLRAVEPGMRIRRQLATELNTAAIEVTRHEQR